MNAATITSAVNAANSAAGDVEGNCSEAAYLAEHGDMQQAAQRLEWAERNARAALHRIVEARAAIAKATEGLT